jgi:meso-butanediol dehydrogenase/(S,S)-butanediol dehydrogenase/diacetyl reductase
MEKVCGMSRFKGKTVLITGAESGIGLVTAQLFAQEEASVVIAGIHGENGELAQQKLAKLGGNHIFIKADVSQEQDVKSLMERVSDFTGRIDVLVNNAAMFYESDFIHESTERWRRVFDVIVDGAYLCTKYAARKMISQGTGGSIVNISSINSFRALKMSSHYNAAKGALDQLTRCTALELSPHDIRVNAVAPGFINAGLAFVNGINELETDEFLEYYINQRKIPLARAGEPVEIAKIIAFLASEESSYIQGAIIPADGGLSITF